MSIKKSLPPIILFLISSSTASFHPLQSSEISKKKVEAGDVLWINSPAPDLNYRVNSKTFSHLKDDRLFGVAPLKGPSYFSLNQLRVSKNFFSEDNIEWHTDFVSLKRQSFRKARDLAFTKDVWQKVGLENEAQRKDEENLVRKILSRSDGDLPDKCWEIPTKSTLSSGYGSPRTLPDGQQYYHTGTDLRAGEGAEVKASQDGEVVFAAPLIVTGNMVMIYHGSGVYSKYMHLSKIDVNVGDKVKKGQHIGEAGHTGRVTGPHLHWEIVWQGNPANPHHFLQAMAPTCDPK